MTKNTAYYKAAFAKSEAASPYSKMNPHMKGHGMHNPSMKMSHDSAMETHDPTHMKMGHKKVESFGKGKKSPPDPGTGLTKKYDPTHMAKKKEKFKDAGTGKTVKIKTRKDGSTKVKVGGKGRGKFEFAPGQNPDDYQLYTR